MTRSTQLALVLSAAGAVLVTLDAEPARAVETAGGLLICLALAVVLTPFTLLALSFYHGGGDADA